MRRSCVELCCFCFSAAGIGNGLRVTRHHESFTTNQYEPRPQLGRTQKSSRFRATLQIMGFSFGEIAVERRVATAHAIICPNNIPDVISICTLTIILAME